jgi:hypothetical protein
LSSEFSSVSTITGNWPPGLYYYYYSVCGYCCCCYK